MFFEKEYYVVLNELLFNKTETQSNITSYFLSENKTHSNDILFKYRAIFMKPYIKLLHYIQILK